MTGPARKAARANGGLRGWLSVMMITNAIVPDQLGGLQRYVRELAASLVQRDVEVTVVARRFSPELPLRELADDGVRIHRFDVVGRDHRLYAARYPVSSVRAVAAAVRAHRGIVHVHYPAQGIAPAILNTRYVHTFHAPASKEVLPEQRNRYRLPALARRPMVSAVRAAERLVASRSVATIVLTDYMRGELAALSRSAAGRAEIIPGGIDPAVFSPGPGMNTPFASAGDPLLFTARRLVPRTGVRELVRAMPAIRARLPSAHLAVAGDGPLRADIEADISRLHLRDSVRLLGRISDHDLVAWYRAASLFVIPTQELEGFGISTIEALACGTPAVGTSVGAIPEVLAPIDPRLLARGPHASDLAEAVVSLCTEPSLLDRLAATARGHVVPRLTWQSVTDRHLALYERANHTH
jgi:glycosyltransferase involved in cell wall biosynthesis